MAGKCNDYVLDNGLTGLKTTATHIYICSSEPVSYAEATTTKALGNKSFGAGNTFTGPSARSPNGRKVTTVAVTDGRETTGRTFTEEKRLSIIVFTQGNVTYA